MVECNLFGHAWKFDPRRRGEGLVCGVCGVSEAELEGDRSNKEEKDES